MAQVQGEDKRRLLDWDALEVGELFEPFSYVLTQQDNRGQTTFSFEGQ